MRDDLVVASDPTPAPRLLSVATRFPWSSETFVLRKARALQASGFDVTVAAPHLYPQTGPEPTIKTIQLPKVRSPRTWTTSARALANDRQARGLISELAKDPKGGGLGLLAIVGGDFDIIHFEFSGIAATVVDLLPHLRPAKLVVSCRGHAEQIAPHSETGRKGRLERVFEQMDMIHCVSADMAETVKALGAPAEKLLVNRPAVDTARWTGVGRIDPEVRGTKDAPLRVLSVGRLHWKKGFDDAIRAVAAARSAGVEIDYRIAGDGPELEKLQYLRHSLDLEGAVTLLGWQDQTQVSEQLGWADVFLLPSLSEGISNSALEALAAGLPTVSTRCGGMEEVLTEPDMGTLVDVGDQAAMVDALRALVDPADRQRLSDGGTGVARSAFDLSRQAAVFGDAYRKLVARS